MHAKIELESLEQKPKLTVDQRRTMSDILRLKTSKPQRLPFHPSRNATQEDYQVVLGTTDFYDLKYLPVWSLKACMYLIRHCAGEHKGNHNDGVEKLRASFVPLAFAEYMDEDNEGKKLSPVSKKKQYVKEMLGAMAEQEKLQETALRKQLAKQAEEQAKDQLKALNSAGSLYSGTGTPNARKVEHFALIAQVNAAAEIGDDETILSIQAMLSPKARTILGVVPFSVPAETEPVVASLKATTDGTEPQGTEPDLVGGTGTGKAPNATEVDSHLSADDDIVMGMADVPVPGEPPSTGVER